jgi:hypothetical protein
MKPTEEELQNFISDIIYKAASTINELTRARVDQNCYGMGNYIGERDCALRILKFMNTGEDE